MEWLILKPYSNNKSYLCYSISWSPNGQYLAVGTITGSDDLNIYSWDGSSLTFIQTIALTIVYSTSWSPNGQYLAVGISAGGNNLIIYSWNGSSLSQLQTINISDAVESVSWSPNGQY